MYLITSDDQPLSSYSYYIMVGVRHPLLIDRKLPMSLCTFGWIERQPLSPYLLIYT